MAVTAATRQRLHSRRMGTRCGSGDGTPGSRRHLASRRTHYSGPQGERVVALGDTPGTIAPTGVLAEAISGAEVVVIPLPAHTHDDLAPQLAPLLENGQVVFLPPGTFGSYLFVKAMADAGNRHDVAFAETGTLPYLARKHGPAEVVVSGYATRLPTGSFRPASQTPPWRSYERSIPASSLSRTG